MRKLDPGRPWGKITPPWSGDNKEFDRPAVKEQDGRLFDQYNCEILPPGKTTKRAASIQGPAPPTVAAEPDDDGGDTMQRLDPSFLENSPDVGKVTPTGWRGDNDEFDRAACYHHAGKYFDAHGVEIVPGKKPKRAAPPPPPDDGDEPEAPTAMPPATEPAAPISPKQYSGAQGMSWGGVSGEKPAPEALPPAAPAPKAKMPVFSRQRRQG